MSYSRITLATIETPTFTDLLAAWKLHGGPTSLVGRFIVDEPLTPKQLRQLPRALRHLM